MYIERFFDPLVPSAHEISCATAEANKSNVASALLNEWVMDVMLFPPTEEE
jgi:hypothetical protein